MKLVRYGARGSEKPGVLDNEGKLRDASAVVADWRGAFLGAEVLAKITPEKLPPVEGSVRFGAPVSGIGKIIGIGLNYREHAAESGMALPDDPIIFLKATSAVNGPNDDIVLPRDSEKTDWEVELGVVIGAGGKNIRREDAMRHIAGYVLANDISEREFQLRRGPQWTKGKSGDTFAPLGPWLATRDEIPDPQNLQLQTDLNGKTMQSGSTADMHFGVEELISRVSSYMSLQPGDIMITGTPPGVGFGQKPPRYLRPGDSLRLCITGLGEQNARIAAPE
ncbi:MAG: fumarylacetoacetate hydrolase family protein [Gammaproteobacteria bacterium]